MPLPLARPHFLEYGAARTPKRQAAMLEAFARSVKTGHKVMFAEPKLDAYPSPGTLVMTVPRLELPHILLDDFGVRPVLATRHLHQRELFTDQALTALLDAYPRQHPQAPC